MMKQWHSCYDSGWKDIIVPEAFSHPAKMSYGLLKRILAHANEQGWLKKGDVIVDPFGGIGSTGILGAYEGYQCVCIELEAKFCKLAEQNFELHKDAWLEFGNPYPVILQGDSRRLCEVVEKADCIISSPPYSKGTERLGKIDWTKTVHGSRRAACGLDGSCSYAEGLPKGYGQTPGQLGSMKPGKVDMVVASPPFTGVLQTNSKGGGVLAQGSESKYPNVGLAKDKHKRTDYGQTPGNLGNLKSGDVDCVIKNNIKFDKGDNISYNPKHYEKQRNEKSNSKQQSRNNKALQSNRDDTNKDGSGVGMRPISCIEDVQGVRDTTQEQGAERQGTLRLQARTGQQGIPKEHPEDTVCKLPNKRESGNTSHQSRPLRQQPRKSNSPVRKLPSEPSQKGVVESQESGQAIQKHRSNRVGQVDCICSSPPYEGSLATNVHTIRDIPGIEQHSHRKQGQVFPSEIKQEYGNSKGQLGADKGDTFWQAAKTIVEQCHQILKPGGHAIWVVKSFVRKKKIVDFPGDWQRLCESVGFKTVCIHHAMLVKETSHKTLFGDTEVKRTERKSFFRRLAESKGSPRIDFEVVLCMEKQPLFPVETKK